VDSWQGRLDGFLSAAIPWGSPGRKAATAILVLGLIGAGIDGGYWFYQRFGRHDLRLTLIDVGQGNAALLEFPGGRKALVDGGGSPDPAAFDVGANVVAPYLWRNKIATVDTLILTHPNSDHLNGLIFIADNFHVRTLWTNGEAREIPGYAGLMQTAARRGITVPPFPEIPRESTINGVRLQVLYPPVDFLGRREAERWRRNENNNSLVTRVSLGEVSVLMPGDLMRAAEKELVELAGDQLRSTVLIAPHHGSRSSNSEEFLRAVMPQAVLVSCAHRPGSGIPHPQVLERYEKQDIRIYRTDRDGAVRLATDGRQVSISPYLNSN
jgi:competence protein ComEC